MRCRFDLKAPSIAIVGSVEFSGRASCRAPADFVLGAIGIAAFFFFFILAFSFNKILNLSQF